MASLTYKDATGLLQSIQFDAVQVVEINLASEITEHPVEEGAPVTDHVRPRLPVVSITAYVSNTPLPSNPGADKLYAVQAFDLPQSDVRAVGISSLASAAIGALGLSESPKPAKMIGALVLPTADLNRAKAMFSLIEKLRDTAALVGFVDTMREYDDMVIESATATRSLEDGKGGSFQITIRKLRVVSAQRVEAPVPAEVRGLPSVSKGSQSTGDDGNAQLKSLAASAWDGAAGAFGSF